MAKMWAGRTSGNVNTAADSFNSSIGTDFRMYEQDIRGSMAHASMLSFSGIITKEEADSIIVGLTSILDDIKCGKLKIDMSAEDIHMFVEEELTKRLGNVGKKLHTARSRNDQVALDTRMYLRKETDEIITLIKELIIVITNKADKYKSDIMSGYTHLQRAQPITFGHQLLSYAFMFLRDIERLKDCRKRINISPIGSCALAGTTYNTDRFFEAKLLEFDGVCENSIDGVSDRDFCAEFIFCVSTVMMHLSRFCEEIILWSSWEFKFVSLSDDFTTGSSIMPQKKNPDIAELVRGKTGRVYGDLITLLTTLKGLPLAYNKDMQEDKDACFDAADTVKASLEVFCGMLKGLVANTDNMERAAKEGFINATDLADYLVGKGLPFRTAYKISGEIVAFAIKSGKVLEELSLETYKDFSEYFDNDLYDAIDLKNCVKRRVSYGSTGIESVENQIKTVKEKLSVI